MSTVTGRCVAHHSLFSGNERLAQVSQIRKFHLIETQLTAEDEELTPTMKLKRQLVQRRYAPQIAAMYDS